MRAPPGVILAGGRSRRMGGGDKALLPLGGGALVAQVVARLAPQVPHLALNANGDPARFAALGLPVLPDPVPDWPGPLAGVLAALDWAAALGERAVVTAAADTPFLPPDLVPRLLLAAEAEARPIALAATPGQGGVQRHPTFGLWPVALRDDLAAALAGGQRRVTDWADRHGAAAALFPAVPYDPFFNVNTPADLARAERMMAGAA